MKKLVTFILIIILNLIFNLNFIYAINNSTQANVTLSYPSQVNFAQEFNVNVTLNNFPNDVYGVRIGIINDSIRLARIWNGSYWQSTYYYINNAINTIQKKTESFRLNITSCYNGNANLELKLRDSKNYVYSFYNYTINIIGNCSTSHNNQTPINNTPVNNTPVITNKGISLNLDWSSEDIKNGKDFEIEINAFNLEDKDYDLKVFIYNEDENKPISQIYNNGKWMSSNSYVNKIFKGPGDKTENVKLRIKDSYKDFNGEATIGARIRESGSSIYKKEIQVTIDILEADKSTDNNVDENSTSLDSDNSHSSDNSIKSNNEESFTQSIDDEVIHNLTSKTEDIKTKKNTAYKSKNELIKEYSIFAFITLIVIFFALLVFYKFRRNK